MQTAIETLLALKKRLSEIPVSRAVLRTINEEIVRIDPNFTPNPLPEKPKPSDIVLLRKELKLVKELVEVQSKALYFYGFTAVYDPLSKVPHRTQWKPQGLLDCGETARLALAETIKLKVGSHNGNSKEWELGPSSEGK